MDLPVCGNRVILQSKNEISMTQKLLGTLAILFWFISCTPPHEPPKENTKEAFMAMSLKQQFAEMAQRGGITQLNINDIQLQRISTGVIRSFPSYSFQYCPVIDIFELSEQGDALYSIGLRKGTGEVLDVKVELKSDTWVEINGLRYRIELHNYTQDNGQDKVQYTFTPDGDVPGSSEDYLNLIAALNSSNSGDAVRPDLFIPDVRVLSLGSLQLTVVLNSEANEELPTLGSCQEVTPQGQFSIKGQGIYEFNSGKGTIIKIHDEEIDNSRALTITVIYNERYTVQFWGSDGRVPETREPFASHENLNGKHIKDRLGNNRTLITPDGTKITLVTPGPYTPVSAITIYHGGSVHHINTVCTKLEYSTANNPFISQRMDELQPDGETSILEDTPDMVWFYNIYNEDSPCRRIYERVNLGSLPKAIPNQVNDLYDDKRLAHT